MAFTQTFLQLVKQRLAFLGDTDDTMVTNFIEEQRYLLQSAFGFDNTQVDDEAEYSAIQKMLIADLSAIEIIDRRIIQNMEGTEGAAATGSKRLKKGVADVVEAEFSYLKASDGTALLMQAEQVHANLKEKACGRAGQLGIKLAFCRSKPVRPPFTVKSRES